MMTRVQMPAAVRVEELKLLSDSLVTREAQHRAESGSSLTADRERRMCVKKERVGFETRVWDVLEDRLMVIMERGL